MAGTLSLEPISTKQAWIAELASRQPRMQLTTLAHHMDEAWLRAAWKRTRKDGAAGVDGMTSGQFAEGLDERLRGLVDSAKSGRWRAPPVRRTYIPKGKSVRPLGIPTLEDKVLQRAFLMLLEPVYEQDFLDCSYGFRPGRNAHQALERLREGLWKMGGGWVLDVDLRSFFDTVDHGILQGLVKERVRDGVVCRMIGKWLNAGVMENGAVVHQNRGTPQGGVLSPLLSNIYLHHAVDVWFEEVVKPRLRGSAFMVRYADDFVMAFETEDDARRVQKVLMLRLGRFKLELNSEKTRLVRFERAGGSRKAETFDFLGFTLYWGKSRRGRATIRWKTSRKSLNKTLTRFNQWCRRNRHRSIPWQHHAITRSLRGHDAYFGLTMNGRALQQLRRRVVRIWHRWLSRRSQRARLTWERFRSILRRFPLPEARVVHSVYRRA